jgi:hypothetical protein
VGTPDLTRELAQGLMQVQRGVTRPLGMVFMGNRRTEQRHDAVAGVLVHRAFEAVHAFGQDGEETFEDLVPFLGVELFGEFHRTLHVGEQHGDLLALAFQGRARLQNPVGEVFGGVGPRFAHRQRGRFDYRSCC